MHRDNQRGGKDPFLEDANRQHKQLPAPDPQKRRNTRLPDVDMIRERERGGGGGEEENFCSPKSTL